MPKKRVVRKRRVKKRPVRRKQRVGRPRRKGGQMTKYNGKRGGSFFSVIKKGLMKAHRFIKKHKLISKTLGIFGKTGYKGSKYAGKAAPWVSRAGYGRRKRGKGLRRAGGALSRSGGGLRRAGGSRHKVQTQFVGF